jgi:hypothetical protein
MGVRRRNEACRFPKGKSRASALCAGWYGVSRTLTYPKERKERRRLGEIQSFSRRMTYHPFSVPNRVVFSFQRPAFVRQHLLISTCKMIISY